MASSGFEEGQWRATEAYFEGRSRAKRECPTCGSPHPALCRASHKGAEPPAPATHMHGGEIGIPRMCCLDPWHADQEAEEE